MTTEPPAGPGRRRRPTSTARFGSSRRESHDASAFYERFVAPDISDDATVARTSTLDTVHVGDARDMHHVEDGSIALVVTSPPYFAGKEYEESLGEDGVPATYFEYLAMLSDVFAECRRVLEPGGRIAVNVANLGRRPYRSLAGDVTEILTDLGLLLRGEVVWWKGRAAGGSCAWGTFQRPGNPVLRDVTERIVIASKGRFDRALKATERAERGLPSTTTVTRDEFLEATTDLWELAPESATRVGHPAPFPVELPQRLIELYTYAGDVVLDPFMGAGTTAVAAVRTDRRYVGYDTDPHYVALAERRVAETGLAATPVRIPAGSAPAATGDELADAMAEGRQAREVAGLLLARSGFADVRAGVRIPRTGVEIAFTARDATGGEWAFDLAGGFTSSRAGLARSDELWRALGTAAVLGQARPDLGIVLLTTTLPTPRTAASMSLASVTGPGRLVAAAVALLDPEAEATLRSLAAGA